MQKNHTRGILAVGIIVLFIGVGIHPAFAVEDKTSTSENENTIQKSINGPDLKIKNVGITREFKWIWQYYINCDVINIGLGFTGYYSYETQIWRWSLLKGDQWIMRHRHSGGPRNWDSMEIKTLKTVGSERFPLGIYRIYMNVSTPGDVDTENNVFDSYFLIWNYFIFPKTIYD